MGDSEASKASEARAEGAAADSGETAKKAAAVPVEETIGQLRARIEALEEKLVAALAEPAIEDVELINWRDDARLGENVRSLVKRIVVDANARRFSVETLTGEMFEYREEGEKAIFEAKGIIAR